jgi:hypothetical protein
MEQICGTCRHWADGKKVNVGSLSYRTELPTCNLLKQHKEADAKPASWCWKEADIFDLVIRKRAGVIDGDYE